MRKERERRVKVGVRTAYELRDKQPTTQTGSMRHGCQLAS